MPTTSVEICNLAFDRIGEAPITALTDDTTAGNLAERCYALTVQELLMSHRWNFATKRTILEPARVAATAVADSGSADEFRVTKATHGLTTGQRVTITETDAYPADNYPAAAGTWRVTVVDANTFDLDDSRFAGSGAVDIAYALAGHWDWSFSIALPADCLRALEDNREESNIGVGWEIEGGRVLTDSEELEFKYIEDVTTVSRFTPLFVSCLVLTLAIKFKVALQGDNANVQALGAELTQLVAPKARMVDANESQRRERLFPRQSYFVAARGAGPLD